ncbi:MAG: dephospho-CoA kinase [Flavobacteria bacterium RIFCSPLOWO2_12_FULL_35_11]|nr:MAG: dephospho-CoA kinase [Flavobacteria bacterium RIFCSPLOWO2_12_FULL_35_11]
MKIIGLTGGIGSGKSTVLALFEALGVVTYIADSEAKKLMNVDAELRSQIVKLFGDEAYVQGELNKTYLASLVFNNAEKLNALNALVHPKVREDFQRFIRKTNADFIIYEAAILFESGSDKFCDYIITVSSSFENKIDRIMKRDKVSEAQILERMKHQSTDDHKIKKSDFVIRNNKIADTKYQVSTIFGLLQKLKNR